MEEMDYIAEIQISEVYNVSDAFIMRIEQQPYRRSLVPTNVDWSRLVLEPITSSKLKTICRSRAVRVALYTGSELRFTLLTRHPILSGRRARRTIKGFYEMYEIGRGWVQIQNECPLWLQP